MIVGLASLTLVILTLTSFVAIAAAAAQERTRSHGEGVGTVRRVSTHLLSFASLLATCIGATWVGQAVIASLSGRDDLSPGRTLALGVSLVVVGAPTWWAFWRTIGRDVSRHPSERSTLARQAYLTIVRTVSVLTAATAAITGTAWVLGVPSFDPRPLATLAVWAPVHLWHARVDAAVHRTRAAARLMHRLHVYVVATISLGVAAVSIAQLSTGVLTAAYRAWTDPLLTIASSTSAAGSIPANATPMSSISTPFISTPFIATVHGVTSYGPYAGIPDTWRVWIAAFLVAAALWITYVTRLARAGVDGWPRSAYLYVIGVLTGTMSLLAGTSIAVYQALQIALGDASLAAVIDRMTLLPAAISAIVVGGVVWAWHAGTAHADTQASGPGDRVAATRRGTRRTVRYLLATVSLGVLAFGIARTVGTALALLAQSGALTVTRAWRDPLVLGLTATLVGGSTWAWVTATLQRALRRRPREERPALVRRLYLTVAYALGLVVSLVSVAVAAFLALDPWLSNRATTWHAWLESASTPLGIAVTATTVTLWHRVASMADRRASSADALGAEPPGVTSSTTTASAPSPRVDLLTEPDFLPAARTWAASWPGPVEIWVCEDASAPPTPSQEGSAVDDEPVEPVGRILDATLALTDAATRWRSSTASRGAPPPVDKLVISVGASGIDVVPVRRS